MLIVIDVWIIYWWCEGNMFADYRHDVCQVQKKNLLLFWAWKAGLLQSMFLDEISWFISISLFFSSLVYGFFTRNCFMVKKC
jgi:hypothetical protein